MPVVARVLPETKWEDRRIASKAGRRDRSWSDPLPACLSHATASCEPCQPCCHCLPVNGHGWEGKGRKDAACSPGSMSFWNERQMQEAGAKA